MRSSRFEQAIDHVLRWEGGLVNHPADPGGWTNYGISLPWLQRQGVDLDGDGDVDAEDIKALTPALARGLYHDLVWDEAYERLASDEAAVFIFDMDVNMGRDRAHRITQRAANALGAQLVVDGRIGPKTIAALNALDQAALLAKLRELRAAFYRELADRKPQLAVFLRGWLRRAAS